MKFEGDDADDALRMIENICYLAVSQTWPSCEKNGPREERRGGFDGARAARVLAAVLSRAQQEQRLAIFTGLETLALDAGLVSHYAVRDALYDLESSGWIGFVLGTQNRYEDGVKVESGRPSLIRLLPKPIAGSCSPKRLPMLTLDAFSADESGHAGWLAMARICFEYGDDFHPHVGLSLGIKDVSRLTGMTYERTKRALPKMAASWLCEKNGRKYLFRKIDCLTERDLYTDYKARKRIMRRNERIGKRIELTEAGRDSTDSQPEAQGQSSDSGQRFGEFRGSPPNRGLPIRPVFTKVGRDAVVGGYRRR